MQYIVSKGDTVSKISTRFGCIPKDFCAWNGLGDAHNLVEGQMVWLSPQKPKNSSQLYQVQYGDSFRSIANKYLGHPSKWNRIAQINNISDESHIFIGQELKLPSDVTPAAQITSGPQVNPPANKANHIPLRSFLFIVADEVVPSSNKVVRKVIFPRDLQGNPELLKQIIQPEKFGFKPINPASNVSVGRHVLGMTDSRYISASTKPLGSPRFSGKPYWINTKRLYSSGSIIHDAEAISKDLDRIAQKTKDPNFRQYIEDIRHKSLKIDKEILIEGGIPPGAVKGSLAKGLTHGLQFVSLIGVAVSVHDLGQAANVSAHEGSIKPLAIETARQAGGWAGAYAGMQLGASVGALIGIETGPGAVLTAAAGSLIFGAAGYLGADWITDYISDEPN